MSRESESEPSVDDVRAPISELIDEVRGRIAGDHENFALSYDDKDLNSLLETGRRLGIDDRSLVNLLQVGSRIAKPIGVDALHDQMSNWATIVSERCYPYKFNDAQHFNDLARDVNRVMRDVGLGDLNVFVQGSALRKPEADDVDFMIATDRERFNKILIDRFDERITAKGTDEVPAEPISLRGLSQSEIYALADQIWSNKEGFNAQARTFANAMRDGIIKS